MAEREKERKREIFKKMSWKKDRENMMRDKRREQQNLPDPCRPQISAGFPRAQLFKQKIYWAKNHRKEERQREREQERVKERGDREKT